MPFPPYLLNPASEEQKPILFIGGDLPASVTGLPSRAELARALAQQYALDEILVSKTTPPLPEVIGRLNEEDPRRASIDFMRQAFQQSNPQPADFHLRLVDLIRSLRIQEVVTTTYDDLLERAFESKGMNLNRVLDDGDDVSQVDRPTLYRLFGCLDRPSSLVLTQEEHLNFLENENRVGLLEAVRTALRRHATLILGYNLSDENILRLLYRITEGRNARPIFAVWPGMLPGDQRFWQRSKIEILKEDPFKTLTENYVIDHVSARAPEVPWDGFQPAGLGRETPAYEMTMTANFDLNELVDQCQTYLRSQRGLVGFAIPCRQNTFLTNFSERLNRTVFRRKARIKDLQKVDPIMDTIDGVLRTVQRRYLADLQHTSVLFTLECTEEELLSRFWAHLLGVVPSQPPENYLVIILPVNPGWQLPPEVITLPEPHFQESHVADWVDQIGSRYQLSQALIDEWYQLILDECYFEDELVVEWVYQHLNDMVVFIERNPGEESFRQELQRRRMEYVTASG